MSKEDAEGVSESHLSNTGTLLRLAGSKVVDVEADYEDRNLLEDFSDGSNCLDDTREAGQSVIKQDLSEIVTHEIEVEKKETAAHPSQAEEKDKMAAARFNLQLAPSVYIR